MGDELKHHLDIVNEGLGMRELATFNQDLLGKWIWWFGVEETRLWRRAVATKFSQELGSSVRSRVVGVPNLFEVLMGLVCGRALGWGGIDFCITLILM